MRRQLLPVIALATVFACGGDAVRAQTKVLKDLAEGRQVSLTGKKTTVGKALDQIAKQAKVELQCVDEFGREDKKAGKEVVTVGVKGGSFWTVVDGLCNAAGLQVIDIKDGAVELSASVPDYRRIEPAGAGVVAGAFWTVPVFDSSRMELQVYPEPWMGRPTMRDMSLTMTDADGKREELKIWFGVANVGLNGWFELSPDLPDDVQLAKTLELTANVDVPLEVKSVTTPPLSKLLPKPIDVGAGTLRPIAWEAREGGKLWVRFEMLHTQVEMSHVGLRIDDSTRLAPEAFRPTGFGDFEARATFDLGGHDASKAKLELDVPKLETVELGRLGDLIGETKAAGLGTVKVVGFEPGVRAKVELRAVGGLIPWDGVDLIGADGRSPDPGRSSSSDENGADITLFVDSSEVAGKVEDLRLVVVAAVSFERRVFAEFADSCATPFVSGPVEALVLSAGPDPDPDQEEDILAVRIEITGPQIDVDSVHLLNRKKQLRRSSWGESGWEPQHLTLTYEKSAAPGGKLDACRMQLDVPKKTLRHELKVTLSDVLLRR